MSNAAVVPRTAYERELFDKGKAEGAAAERERIAKGVAAAFGAWDGFDPGEIEDDVLALVSREAEVSE